MKKIIKENQVIKIDTKNTSMILKINSLFQVENVYYGKYIDKFEIVNEVETRETGYFNYIESSSKEKINYNVKENLIPTRGLGDFRYSMLEIEDQIGKTLLPFLTIKEINDQSTYQKNEFLPLAKKPDQTIELVFEDKENGIIVFQTFKVFKNDDVIVKNTAIQSTKNTICINKIFSSNISLPEEFKFINSISCNWANEYNFKTNELNAGQFIISSRSGVSSSGFHPFSLVSNNKHLKDNQGEIYSQNIIYSGNWKTSFEQNNLNLRISYGINNDTFKWKINKDEIFETPEVIHSFSEKGINGIRKNNIEFAKKNVISTFSNQWINLNTWETFYFNVNAINVEFLAKKANQLKDVELFVLDDGWFGKRNDDKTSLGDWFVNKDKFTSLKQYVDIVKKNKLKPGIWIEPEMVSKYSELYKKHPNWVLKNETLKTEVVGRNQFVLDITKKEVKEFILKTFDNILENTGISYVKWDMNRKISSMPSDFHYHRYVLSLYEIMKKLKQKYPHVLFEGCAGGGDRTDLGINFYFPQIWISDNTDPFERMKMQYVTSLFLPLSSTKCHITSKRNEQTFKVSPIETKFQVASFGILGLELNLSQLEKNELEFANNYLKWYKENQKDILQGNIYSQGDPNSNSLYCFYVVTKNKVFVFAKIDNLNQKANKTLKFFGLKDDKYIFENQTFSSSYLKNQGLDLTPVFFKNKSNVILFEILKK